MLVRGSVRAVLEQTDYATRRIHDQPNTTKKDDVLTATCGALGVDGSAWVGWSNGSVRVYTPSCSVSSPNDRTCRSCVIDATAAVTCIATIGGFLNGVDVSTAAV